MPIIISGIEFNRIQDLRIDENRAIVEHRIPGSNGDIFQDLGRKPVTIAFEGIFQGKDGFSKLRDLRQKFNDGETLTFSSDAATPTDVDQVIIKNLRVNEIAGRPQFFRFAIVLKEIVERQTGLPDIQALTDIDMEIIEENSEIFENLGKSFNALLELNGDANKILDFLDDLSPEVSRLGDLINKLPDWEKSNTEFESALIEIEEVLKNIVAILRKNKFDLVIKAIEALPGLKSVWLAMTNGAVTILQALKAALSKNTLYDITAEIKKSLDLINQIEKMLLLL